MREAHTILQEGTGLCWGTLASRLLQAGQHEGSTALLPAPSPARSRRVASCNSPAETQAKYRVTKALM